MLLKRRYNTIGLGLGLKMFRTIANNKKPEYKIMVERENPHIQQVKTTVGFVMLIAIAGTTGPSDSSCHGNVTVFIIFVTLHLNVG